MVRETGDPEKLARERPFLGVPLTTKDCFAVDGLSYTTGLKCREGQKADFNAPAIQRMIDAGAIPIGTVTCSCEESPLGVRELEIGLEA